MTAPRLHDYEGWQDRWPAKGLLRRYRRTWDENVELRAENARLRAELADANRDFVDLAERYAAFREGG